MSLEKAIALLEQENVRYQVVTTYPTRDFFSVDPALRYVIRQRLGEDDMIELTVAAKMRKEVL